MTINQMHDLLILLVGWVLGVLSLLLLDVNRRKQRRKDLVSSVVNEIEEFQYVLAVVAFKMRLKVSTFPDEFLDWILPVVSSYSGLEKDSKLEETFAKIRECSMDERNQVITGMQDVSKGATLKQYPMPVLVAQANEMSICPLDFQSRVFRVKFRLDLFNQHVSYLQGQFEKTFDPSIVDDNRKAVKKNLTEGYKDIGGMAEDMAKMIGEIISRYGSP